MKFARYLVSLSLGVATATLATAHAADTPPSGAWRGVLQGDHTPRMATQLNFQPDRVRLTFAEPANCRTEAAFVEKDAKGYHYNLKIPVNGGPFCDRLYPGQVVVSGVGPKELKVSFPASKANWIGTFAPSDHP